MLVDRLLPVCDVLLQLFDAKKVILSHLDNLKGIHLSTLSNKLVPLLWGKDLRTSPFLRFYATEISVIRKVRMATDHEQTMLILRFWPPHESEYNIIFVAVELLK